MRIFRPSGAPPWLEQVLTSIERGLREIWPVPFRLWRIPTADLPPAADYEGSWLYDSTAELPKFSNGVAWASVEPFIAAGTTAQYWRGDKSWQPLNAAAVANVPAGTISALTVQAAINELDTEKLAAGAYTAEDILAKLLTVDGAGSGLDADLLDGQSGAHYLARANHTGTQTASTISDFNTASDARVAAAVGVSVQAFDAQLAAIAGLTPAADQMLYWTGATTAAMTSLTASGRTLMAATGVTGTGSVVRGTGPSLSSVAAFGVAANVGATIGAPTGGGTSRWAVSGPGDTLQFGILGPSYPTTFTWLVAGINYCYANGGISFGGPSANWVRLVNNEIHVNGIRVVTNQQAAIANHASDATVNSILAALRSHGLIAT